VHEGVLYSKLYGISGWGNSHYILEVMHIWSLDLPWHRSALSKSSINF